MREQRTPEARPKARPVKVASAGKTPRKATTPRSKPHALDLKRWRDYETIFTGSLWMIPARDNQNGHSYDYHGNCVPQIITQLLARYTKPQDVLLDLFAGSGTSLIEAANQDRRALGVELQASMTKTVNAKLKTQGKSPQARVIQGDSSDSTHISPKIQKALHQHFAATQAQFLFLHPPYADIIRFSDDPSCLSNAANVDGFIERFESVARVGFDFLEAGRFAAVVIGDKYENGELIPLGFLCLAAMQRAGFKTKAIVVKNMTGNERGKGKTANLWRYRALAGGFYLFDHEYVLVFEKPHS